MRSPGLNARPLAGTLVTVLVLCSVVGASCPTEAAPPRLMVAGVQYFENDGVEPIEGKVGDTFTFAIRYQDPDNDPPKKGYPRLLIDLDGDGQFNGGDDLNLTTDHMKVMDNNYALGVDFAREWIFDEPGTYSYAFFAMNERNETAFIGPFDGPAVRAKDQGHANSDRATEYGLFGLLLFVMAVVFIVVGIGAGQRMERTRWKRRFEAYRKR